MNSSSSNTLSNFDAAILYKFHFFWLYHSAVEYSLASGSCSPTEVQAISNQGLHCLEDQVGSGALGAADILA